jgi:hypothetical protein
MSALRARVRAGRLILDEATSLPEGTELRLVVDAEDDLDASARQEIDKLLEEAEADRLAGRSFPAEDLLRELEAIERASAT